FRPKPAASRRSGPSGKSSQPATILADTYRVQLGATKPAPWDTHISSLWVHRGTYPTGPALVRNPSSGLLSILGLLLLALSPARAETILLTGATVHTVSSTTLAPGQVLVKDGKIEAVGLGLPAQADRVIDLKGLHLYPGLIAATTSLGLTEIGAVRATRDSIEVGDYTPDVESWIAINPDSELIPVARANGIAYALPVPQGGIVSGLSGLIKLDGWTAEQMTVKKPVALHLFWPNMALDTTPKERLKSKWKSPEDQAKERDAKLKAIDDFFEDARAYAKAREAAKKGETADPGANPSWEAMLPFERGEIPLMIHADELRQIKAAVKWAGQHGYKMILAGGRDAWKVADLLAPKKIPVIYENVFTLPQRDTESYDVHFQAPEILSRAGVQVIFSEGLSDFGTEWVRNLPYTAAQAMAFGLPEDEALKGITLYPAQALGVGDRLGAIAVGKDATLVATDGDLLDIRSNVKRMWIDGHEVSLESRHTRLYEKYRNRPRPAAR
ncbi:MAG: amidohydrolase family protein, partial [Limisphaerales bacterium]